MHKVSTFFESLVVTEQTRVKPLTFDQKRIVAGIYLAVLLLTAGNHYLEWGLFGDSAKAVQAVVVLVGVLAMARYLPEFQREMEERNEALREAEIDAERIRDKSNDAVEAERLRSAIGMPPNKSLERTRER